MTALDDGPSVESGKDTEQAPPPAVPVTAHESAPGRTVFVEADNTDGWISSSLTVDLRR
ncbi:MAG: hypothetical protein ABEH61_01295 [Haloarculaceae archaeon]